MSNFKLFLDNFLIYGIGGIINKLIPFFMLPVITRLMPNSSYFGLSDLTNTLVAFGNAFAIMGMYDAAFRIFFDKNDRRFQKIVCSTALLFVLGTSSIVFLLLLIFHDVITIFFFGSSEYHILIYFAAISILIGSTNTILTIPTRVQNKRIIFLSINFLSSIIAYSISVFLLLKGQYLIALPTAAVFSFITIGISFYIINKKWFNFNLFKFSLLKEMLVIALPMMPEFFIYWILGSCDRIMIVHFIGDEAAGVYAASAKLASASQLIYLAFAGGWQYFAFSTMTEKNQVKNNSLIFEYLGIISFIATSFVCALSYNIVRIFYPQSYQYGYIVIPYLFLAPLLLMLYQVLGNQFLIIKKTWPGVLIVFGCVVINLLCNYFLIPILGIEGGGIATVIGYAASVFICSVVLLKMELLKISNKFLLATFLIVVNILIWRVFLQDNVLFGLLAAFTLTVLYLYIYKENILEFMREMKSKY